MIITIVIPSFHGGGAEKVGINLANHYVATGHQVNILCLSPKGPYRTQISPSIKVIAINKSAKFAFPFLLAYFIRNRCDLVISVISITNFLISLVAPFINSIILFREANTLDPILKQGFLMRNALILMRRYLYPFATFVIANSVDTREHLLQYCGLSDEHVVCISNPVLPSDLDHLKAQNIPNFNHIFHQSNFVILTVGRLHHQKNQIHLLQACHELLPTYPNLKLVILGEGPEYISLSKYISTNRLENHIFILPFQSNPYPFYFRSNLFVLCSLWEGFGNVLVEALACGVPVISTSCNGGPEHILKNGRLGTLVMPNNLEALTLSIRHYMEGKISNPCAKLVKRYISFYSIKSISQQYLKLPFVD